MNKLELERLYLTEHLTLAEIGELYGKPRQTIFYWIKKFGIDTSTAERFNIKCDNCRSDFSITRKKWKISNKHFCCMSCRIDYLRSEEYAQSRTSQRIARAVIEESGRTLKPGEVVHHIDDNNMNNDLSNLVVFKSNADHMKHHHKLRYEKVIEGKETTQHLCYRGSPKGTPYNETRCAATVSDKGISPLTHQCYRKPGKGPDGLYCGQDGNACVREGVSGVHGRVCGGGEERQEEMNTTKHFWFSQMQAEMYQNDNRSGIYSGMPWFMNYALLDKGGPPIAYTNCTE